MKKNYLYLAYVILMLPIIFPNHFFGQTKDSKKVDDLFEQWNKPNSAGVAISVVRDGKVIYQKGFGTAVLENNVPITPKTIFQSASVSKQFTAFAVLLLANQGKLKLEDDVRKYLSEVPDFGKTITIRHLLNHTSGLRDQAELAAVAGVRLDDVLTQGQVLKIVQRQKELNFTPGEEIVYCNTGYTLLAEIVARVSGKSFRQFTEENILKPLEMSNTHFHDDYVMVVPNRASSYFQIGEGRFIYLPSNNSHVGATNLMTTAEDFAKWLNNFESGKVGGKTLIAQMQETGYLNNGNKTDYGAGFDLETYRGLNTISHGGGDAGFRSFMIYFPKQKFGVAILSNLGNFVGRDIAKKIADIYLERELKPQSTENNQPQKSANSVTFQISNEKLNEYLGDYYSEELDTTYKIVFKDGNLIVQHFRNDDVSLNAVSADKFSAEVWWFKSVLFTRDGKGNIEGFRLSTFRGVRNLKFVKR